jgi:hypothetical protein
MPLTVTEAADLIAELGPAGLWSAKEIAAIIGQVAPPPTPAPYHIPGPYEIALAFGAALASTGKYETPGAAMAAAWTSIPEFYMARDQYLGQVAPVVFKPQEAAGNAA